MNASRPIAVIATGLTLLQAVILSVRAGEVTTTADTGPGSLRQVIADASPGANITFAPGLSGETIALVSGQLTIGKAVTIDASPLPGGLTLDAEASIEDQRRILAISPGGEVTLLGLTLTGGFLNGESNGAEPRVETTGGAIRNDGTATLVDCHLTGNVGRIGGAVVSYSGSGPVSFTARRCSFTQNSSQSSAGGLINWSDIHTAEMRLEECSFSGNIAGSVGGSIFNFSSAGSATLVVRQCTITANEAGLGSGIFNIAVIEPAVAGVVLDHCTISANTSRNGGGAIHNRQSSGTLATCEISNTIIASNAPLKTVRGDVVSDSGGTILSHGGNLIGKTDPSDLTWANDQTGTAANPLDPALAPPANYGGRTQTMPQLPGSPAIDMAVPLPDTPATEQRGLPRVANTIPDTGATEYQGDSELPLFWNLDPDGDGNPLGTERALGSNSLVSDVDHSGNPVMTTNPGGDREVTFGMDPAVTANTIWILKRSIDLIHFAEIYRFHGPDMSETLAGDIASDIGVSRITITDQNSPIPRAFYLFEAEYAPPLESPSAQPDERAH